MRQRFVACLLVPFLGVLGWGTAAGEERPKGPRPAPVKVIVDTSETPELTEWSRKAKKLVEEWHPRIARLLPSEGFTPPGDVKIVFKKDMKGVAFTSGRTITIAASWIKKHPDDYGMVVHELTHVVQAYPRAPRDSGWLVEGIADYIRFFQFEPETRVTIPNPARASYRDSYRTAAKFLAWIEKTHDKAIVRKLNDALRNGKYRGELFKKYTSKTVDELWAAFIASLRKSGD
jgi:hypothetical protein